MHVHKVPNDLGKGGDHLSIITGTSNDSIACGVIGITEEFDAFEDDFGYYEDLMGYHFVGHG